MVDTPGVRARLRLKLAMLATLTSPVTTTLLVARSALLGDVEIERRRSGVRRRRVGIGQVVVLELAGERGGLGLGGGEIERGGRLRLDLGVVDAEEVDRGLLDRRGRCVRGGRDGADRGGHVGQARRIGHGLGHGRDAGRVLLGVQALEEGAHLGLEGGDDGGDPLDPCLDGRGVLLHLAVEAALARGDAALGLLADPGDLGLRPLADRGDVVVGAAAQVGRLVGGTGVDGFDDALRLDLEAGHGLAAGGLGGGLHRAAQVGHELGGATGGRGGRLGLVGRFGTGWRVRHGSGLDHVGFLGLLGHGGVAHGGRILGLAGAGGPREPEAWSCLGGHVGENLGLRTVGPLDPISRDGAHRVSDDGSGAVD